MERLVDLIFSGPDVELPPSEFLHRSVRFIGSHVGVIQKVQRGISFSDYPRIIQYEAVLCHSGAFSDGDTNEAPAGFGTAFESNRALVKAIGEAFDRYASSIYRKDRLLTASPAELGEDALDLRTIAGLSSNQLRSHPECRYDERSRFRWTEGYSWTRKKRIFIPAQLVFVPYIFMDDEPILRMPLTTGVASGTSPWAAAFRGLCEVIERDAFMIAYLNRHSAPSIPLDSTFLNPSLRNFISSLSSWGLELHLFDLSTDIPIPIVGAAVIDKRAAALGNVSLLQLGAAANFDAAEAATRAIEESLQGLYWVRLLVQTTPKEIIRAARLDPQNIVDHAERALFWSSPGSESELAFLWSGDKSGSRVESLQRTFSGQKEAFTFLANSLNDMGYDVLLTDLAPEDLKNHGIFVIKSIVPELHPLHLFEKYKSLGGSRLYYTPVSLGWRNEVPSEMSLNNVPHPFL